MKKILYASGDSFVAGMECLGDGSRGPENKELAFPKYLATALNCEQYINNAYHGATNDFIFRRTILDLKELENSGVAPADVFVLVGFTSLNRIEVDGDNFVSGYLDKANNPMSRSTTDPIPPDEYIDYGTVFLTPNNILIGKTPAGKLANMSDNVYPFCVKYLWTAPVQIPSQIARIDALHTFLKLKGYKHVIISTCSDEIEFPNNSNFFNTFGTRSFYEYGLTEYPEDLMPHNHFGSITHRAYADELIAHVRNNIL